jgi:hypothetical protein
MNKHTVITLIAIIVIIIPIVHSGLSIAGAQQVEYRWDSPGQFSYFTMLNNGKMEFCNTLPFWITFQNFQVSAFYQNEILGSYNVQPMTIDPFSSTVREGVFTSEEMEEAQHILMTFDFEFNGGNVRLDPNQFIIIVNTNTPILGIIPYSTTMQMSGFEFDQIMNTEDLSCN